MSKRKVLYICSECGHEHLKWNGKCADCGEWNTLEEYHQPDRDAFSEHSLKINNISALPDIKYDDETRFDTGSGEMNRVLGGGLVKGSLVLISGDPGIGKSTLLLKMCGYFGKEDYVFYVSGEESRRQIKLRADRLNIQADKLLLVSETDLDAVINSIKGLKPKPFIVIIDSIQTMTCRSSQSSAGSVTQVRECTNLLMRMAKTEDISVFIIGHVNKDGGIAGPKVLEHIVDTVLYFEGDKQMSYRILRAAKNRFGSTNEIGVFEMRDNGLSEVPNPSAMLLSGRPEGVSGISILCTMEGSRPILAEVQALVSKSGFGQPRRVANGFDYNRLCLLLAVLEKRTGFLFGAFDVYINIIGGLKIEEPAADLAVALALYSGLCDIAIPESLAVLGEIGLGGEVRNVTHVRERIRECARMGFSKVIIPKAALKSLDKSENYGIKIIGVSNLKQMFKAISDENKG